MEHVPWRRSSSTPSNMKFVSKMSPKHWRHRPDATASDWRLCGSQMDPVYEEPARRKRETSASRAVYA